ncbi:60S ribosomal protein L13 [Halotydeus destructor]|nr:60S ribosomal protein L13 [Halotydeus destructor]
MPAKRNNVIPNGHFHKDWQRYIKTWFDQPMRKQRRHKNRVAKAQRVAPRPAAGALRPMVTCPSMRYNMKVRLGRGFSLEELKAANINAHEARSVGIAVDRRRTNKSTDSLQKNVQRLKEYKSRLILFPVSKKKRTKKDSPLAQIKTARQLQGVVLPLKDRTNRSIEKARVPSADEKAYYAFHTTRSARSFKRLVGVRAKKAKEAAEALDAPKK